MIANFPSIMMFLHSAKRLAIHFMHFVAYVHGSELTKNPQESIYHQSVSILLFNLDVSQQAA